MTLKDARELAQALWGNGVGYAHPWENGLCAVGEIKDRDGGFTPYGIDVTYEQAFVNALTEEAV